MSFLPTAKMPPTLQSNISCCRKLHWLWISFFVSTGDLIVTLNKVRLNKQLQLVWRERINTSTWDWQLPQSNPDNFLTSLSVGLKVTREQFPGNSSFTCYSCKLKFQFKTRSQSVFVSLGEDESTIGFSCSDSTLKALVFYIQMQECHALLTLNTCLLYICLVLRKLLFSQNLCFLKFNL